MRRRGTLPVLPPRPSAQAPGLWAVRAIPAADVPQPPFWWLSCHGFAGASTLAEQTEIGEDAAGLWQPPPAGKRASVVLVCRASAAGTWRATGAVEQWIRRSTFGALCPKDTDVIGLVAVAASSRKAPPIATERLQLLAGWVPKVWHVGWQETLLAADDPASIGVPPDVAAIRRELMATLNLEGQP